MSTIEGYNLPKLITITVGRYTLHYRSQEDDLFKLEVPLLTGGHKTLVETDRPYIIAAVLKEDGAYDEESAELFGWADWIRYQDSF